MNRLRVLLTSWLFPTLNKDLGRLRSGLSLVRQDLDCDVEGSLAERIEDMGQEIGELRSMIAEWVPVRADDELKRDRAA